MGMLGEVLKHPDDFYPLLKLKLAARNAERQIPPQKHWGFCYSMLLKVSRSFALVIQQLGPDLRDAVCIFYLVLRALDTVEDDTSIPNDTKVPILEQFHNHIYQRDWHFPCGTNHYKVLMDEFHHVSTAFSELEKGYQEAIADITRRMGEGMAKFILQEVETVDEYDEYCHYVAGLVGLGLSKLFHASGKEDLASDHLSNSMGLFLQKTNIIRDYLEDINEIPKSRTFWPRQIWSKYVEKLEDLKYEENSEKAVQCLNDMVTNALLHAEDCLKYMSALHDPCIFRFCAIPQIMAIGTLALCYNNIQVFRGVVKMRRGLTAKVIDRTKTKSDVYGAFHDFSSVMKSKNDGMINWFVELASILDPERPPKIDKAAILTDVVRMATQLRTEAQKLKDSNESLHEKIKELKAEKNELRDEKQRLKVEKEKVEQQVKATTAQLGFLPHPPAVPSPFTAQAQAAGNKLMPFIGYPGIAIWQFMPPTAVDTSQDHVLRHPVA